GLDLGITLETVKAAGASLTQRAGRAGRLRAGRCHRLFTRQDERSRELFLRPEICGLGGKTLALQLASLGLLERWRELPWLTSPDPAALQEGREWLSQHGLLQNGRLTARGRQVFLSTCPPRAGLFGSLA